MLGAGHPDQVVPKDVEGREEWVSGGAAPLPGVDATPDVFWRQKPRRFAS